MEPNMTNTHTAASPTNIKRFLVKEDWKDYQVTLEVDMEVLTDEKATMINDFWTGSKDRLGECNGDVRATVVRLFGQNAICTFLQDGGVCTNTDWVLNRISKELRGEEGWGGEDDDAGLFGWCGIRVVSADVEMPSFDDLELSEIES